jgi:putative SOS response-associated peptidase YedK
MPSAIESAPHYNIAPTQSVLAIANDPERSVGVFRWGLVPPWSAGPAEMKLSTFNARIETIATARAFAGPLRSKRCAIFADGYYEWRRLADGSKSPLLVRRRDGEPFVFAGLWDTWRGPGETLESCTIVTQPPNELMRQLHSRMPVVLRDDLVPAWLDPRVADAAEMLALLEPAPADEWEAYAVSRRVGNVRNDDAGLIEPEDGVQSFALVSKDVLAHGDVLAPGDVLASRDVLAPRDVSAPKRRLKPRDVFAPRLPLK